MANDLRISEMLGELHDSDRTPEEICADFPDLLPQLRERWRRVCRLEAELDMIFPPELGNPELVLRTFAIGENFPQIPGYEVESLLGRGGMGVVFKARHIRLNRVVALKLATAGAYAAPRERERFQREAEAVAALRHANVVQVYDVGESEGCPYFTMEFVTGGTLAEQAKPTTPRQAASLLLSLTSALQAAHSAGIIHRDLKPANVLLDQDGTPKISDFGLSRRIDDAASLTLYGSVVGTPSYMAPEQAAGDHAIIKASVDIYAFGAILYELLTGRPPFRGESPSETIRQVLHSDPLPPSRLNAKIPRDIEIICLKCLSKDPARRYLTATELGGDLRRFVDGEAIEARPEGRVEQLTRRIRRRPGTSIAIAFAAALICAALWLVKERFQADRLAESERAAIESAAADDLREMVAGLGKKDWNQATTAFERAKGRVGERGMPGLRHALKQGGRDLEIVARLDAIRTDLARNVEDDIDYQAADQAYEAAFRVAGLGGIEDSPETVAGLIRSSNIRIALVEGLDDWPVSPDNLRRKAWLLDVARMADPNQTGWVVSARDLRTRKSHVALDQLCNTAPVESQSVSLLLALAGDLASTGGDPIRFLMQIQEAHPGDFWANVCLMDHLIDAFRDAESVRYAQAAVSLRPNLSIGYNGLARALLHTDQLDEAVGPFRIAQHLDPASPNANFNLGHILTQTHRSDEAIELYRKALNLAPDSAILHSGLGDSLLSQDQRPKALVAYQRALKIDPSLTLAQSGERRILILMGGQEEARVAWRAALERDRTSVDTWDGYPELCLYLGRVEDYIEARREVLERFGGTNDPRTAERLGRACLLMHAPSEITSRATELVDRAINDAKSAPLTWTYPYFMFVKGLADYRSNQFEDAIAILDGETAHVLGPCPQLVTAMAQYRLGRKEVAQKTLASAIDTFDWQGTSPDTREVWIYHILRREAEDLIGVSSVGEVKRN